MESHIDVAKALNGLVQPNQLKSVAASDVGSSSELDDSVQKFEAYFIQSMLKSMRSASLSTGLLDSDKSDFYRDWHDQQLASDLASKETFAIAKLLRRQFIGDAEVPGSTASLKEGSLFSRSPYSSDSPAMSASNVPTVVASIGTVSGDSIKSTLKQLVTKDISESNKVLRKSDFSTPEVFVQKIYPHAENAAKKLNISADVLVAIAALETGWGLHTPKSSYGQDSFNYFGIKAANWQGPGVTNITKEFDGEEMVVMQDDFRVYESPADSFSDFAEFLLTNPRYQDAVNNSTDAKAFVGELQKAGYATDPNYANKINSILDGSILNDAIYSLDKLESTENEVSYYENSNTH
ncbi:MAG: flagellar assembly peptidoglycan hydrolase FlgJ [Gammaproteobacteria bacterium]